ncbi:MAG: hypothetical protein PF488_01655 [Patescibacteria group bacterium]|nr:hypothetical protein [Patescibacteria group bacterium]
MEENGLKIKKEDEKKEEVLNREIRDKKFVLTGSLSSLTRGQAKDKIKTLGGKVKDNVTSDTDYVVVGDDPGSKYEKAKKIGVKTLEEDDFLNLLK